MSYPSVIIDTSTDRNTMTTAEKTKAIADWYVAHQNEVEYEDWIAQHQTHLALAWYVENDFVDLKPFGEKLIDLFYDLWSVEQKDN